MDDCEIDPAAYQGELEITNYVVKKSEESKRRVIGSFEIANKDEMGLVEILLKIDGVEEIAFYTIRNESGKSLISEDRTVAIENSFTYLAFLQKELENLKIQCYDKAKAEKYTAYFDSLTYEIYVLEE